MNINDEGLALIKFFEGCRLTAYPDPGTGGAPFTIGYGCTAGVKEGDMISQDMAELMLLREISKVETFLNGAIHADINPNQFSACVSLAYNIGNQNFAGSTLLKMINSGSADGAADQFPRWNRAAGNVMPGLVKRRAAERLLYLGEDWRNASLDQLAG